MPSFRLRYQPLRTREKQFSRRHIIAHAAPRPDRRQCSSRAAKRFKLNRQGRQERQGNAGIGGTSEDQRRLVFSLSFSSVLPCRRGLIPPRISLALLASLAVNSSARTKLVQRAGNGNLLVCGDRRHDAGNGAVSVNGS